MKVFAAILTFLICCSHVCTQVKAQAYFLFPNETEIKNLYTEAKEITDGLERFQTPTTWRSGTHSILARVIDFREGRAYFENNEGVVVPVDKSKLDLESQHELEKFEALLQAREAFVSKHKLEPQIVKLYADMKQAEKDVRLREDLIFDLRKGIVQPPIRREAENNRNRRGNGRAAARDVPIARGNRAVENVQMQSQLTARPLTNTIYIMKNASRSFRQETFMPVDRGDRMRFGKNDERRAVGDASFSSDDESILVVREDSDGNINFIFLKDGEVGLTVSTSDNHSTTEIFDVVELDFARGTSSDDVLRSFGPPSSKAEHLIEWPATASIDNISYVPTINQKTLSAEHWRFRNRPGFVLSIVNNRLYDVGFETK